MVEVVEVAFVSGTEIATSGAGVDTGAGSGVVGTSGMAGVASGADAGELLADARASLGFFELSFEAGDSSLISVSTTSGGRIEDETSSATSPDSGSGAVLESSSLRLNFVDLVASGEASEGSD